MFFYVKLNINYGLFFYLFSCSKITKNKYKIILILIFNIKNYFFNGFCNLIKTVIF